MPVDQYKVIAESGTRFHPFRHSAYFAPFGLFLPVLWFLAVFLWARPLANGPVADSWIYLRTIDRWNAGIFALPGFTAAIPLAQILYGTLWSRLMEWTQPHFETASIRRARMVSSTIKEK